jgi:hypothetical protein
MPVIEFLDKSKVKCKVSEHHPTFTAQHMAAKEDEPGKYLAKPVIGVALISARGLEGIDALLSTIQMPPGVPAASLWKKNPPYNKTEFTEKKLRDLVV